MNPNKDTALPFPPRVLRHKFACIYLGMDKNRFNREVRPFVPEISMGVQGVCFDRLDLDTWWEQYKGSQRVPHANDRRIKYGA